jgi:1-acyl-sn-glycerol-3-phosphate acyltransferase
VVLVLVTYATIATALLVNWRRSRRSFASFIGLGTVRIYARLWHGCIVDEPVAVPATGPAILVSNHTSSPDGTFIQTGSWRGLTFLFAREFYEDLPLLRWVWHTTACVPVTRGICDIRAVRDGLRRLQEGRVVCIFPEGNLSGAGTRRLRTARCGAALLALRSKAPVFPLFISGGPQGPQVGPAWLYPSRARVTYGRAIDLSPYYDRPINRRLLEEVTDVLMRHIAALDPHNRRKKEKPEGRLP